MRPSRRAVVTAWHASGAATLAALLVAVGSAYAAAPDSTAPPPPSKPDSVLTAPAPDTSATRAAPLPSPSRVQGTRDTMGLAIGVDRARKMGEGSLAELLRTRRPVALQTAPSFEPDFGTPTLPGSGEPVRPRPLLMPGDRATDRTVIAGIPYLMGVPGLATALRSPESEGIDPFDFVAIDSSLAPGLFRGPGELFANPPGVVYTEYAMPDPPHPYHVRSALLYRKGDGSLLDTAARFSTPLFARGVAGSFVRHEADALTPFFKSLSTRYHLAAGILRKGPVRAWVEGRLFKMRMEMDYPGGYASGVDEHGRAEWASRDAALHALGTVAGIRATGTVRAGEGKSTQIGYGIPIPTTFQGRERWQFPEVSADLRLEEGDSLGWIWSIAGQGSTRRAEYRDDLGAFGSRYGAGRVTVGMRRTGPIGVAADVAGDAREGDAPFLDARLSVWTAGPRARLRIDAESAHERPTFVDLLSPERADTILGIPNLILRRGGAPDLRARTMNGALATASVRATRLIEVHAFGSARRATDDFGWNATRTDSAGFVILYDVAGVRGSGWLWHAGAGIDAKAGPLQVRGVAWTRGETSGLSPRAGSPPRAGADAAVSVHASFFQGDLPLELVAAVRATGPRHGLIEAPALATWDARLRADFQNAGVFFNFTNVFDQVVPSSIYEIDKDAGAPLPERAFSFGIVWYLFD
jgi:hypothetical protein